MEAVRFREFTSGRRDLNPGPHKATPLAKSGLFDPKELPPYCPETSSLRESGTTGLVGGWWRI
jgi:hypothetical protein